ncbi:hypothetical protein [Haloarcula sp. Atlit-7R]|uniref:hypothetical protein n=1 Tax=Haloarcula sp. Atlit-7R TaxID=2282125 RepID=UPI0011C3A4BF|nr:hypothetical protein [Haloarcula sp. Atlit-7R]
MPALDTRTQDDDSRRLSFYQEDSWRRRQVLSAGTVTVLTALSGCLGFLNQSGDDASPEQETSVSSDREIGRDETSNSRDDREPQSEIESPDASGSAETTLGNEFVNGPVDSPLTNDHPWIDDPEGNLQLTDVTVHMGTEWVFDYHLVEDDVLEVSVAGDRFIVEGNVHLEWECDTFGLTHVLMNGRVGEIYLEPVANDACRTNENSAGRGPWLAPFSVTGRFNGGRPDALEVHLEGPFIQGDGPRGGAYTFQEL